jgi:hypothetical protein
MVLIDQGKFWLLGENIYRTILPYFKKLSQHYNNIPEFMKVGASA